MSTIQVPLLDLKSQLSPLRSEILEALTEVLDSTQYIMGAKIDALEQAIGEYTGVSEAIGVSSGTDALLLALMALDIGPGDCVITSSFSFFATAGVISRLNARPVFVDIDPISYNLDPERLKETLHQMSEEERRQVKAIIPVHLYGQCADMTPILNIANSYQIPVIEDAAQAIGAEYLEEGAAKKAGSLGTMGCFSFFPTKNLGGIGDGGMVVTSDPKLAEILRIKRVHGGHPKYYHKVIGGNFRLDPIQAVVLSIKLPYLNQWHHARQQNAHRYTELIQQAELSQVQTPTALYQEQGLPHYHIYNQYVIRVPDRDALREFLGKNQISAEIYYPFPFHLQECFHDLGYQAGDFPQAEKAAKEVLALPVYPEITEAMQAYAVQKIKEFYEK